MTCRQALAVTGNYTHAVPYNSESTTVLRYNCKLFLPLTDPRKEPRFCDQSFFVSVWRSTISLQTLIIGYRELSELLRLLASVKPTLSQQLGLS